MCCLIYGSALVYRILGCAQEQFKKYEEIQSNGGLLRGSNSRQLFAENYY